VTEFWADSPSEEALKESGLAGLPLLMSGRAPKGFDTSQLTANEHVLLEYLQARPGEICEKDTLIQAVWSEDEIFERGVRDDSLAQLVRRLRVKIEPDPSEPRYIQTITGRGYRFLE
jgi:DNA-binding winged helix-turn-helix (wHTH) protein